MADLQAHAVSVGHASILDGANGGPRLDLRWRAAMIESCLTEANDHWVLADGYAGLDGSEKTVISYVLGMTQGSVIAERLFGAGALVHVDAVLRLLGHLYRAGRPDLIGWAPLPPAPPGQPLPGARILLEAKGTAGRYDSRVAERARAQLKPQPGVRVNRNLRQLALLLGSHAIYAVSVAHFAPGAIGPGGTDRTEDAVWRNFVQDPPPGLDENSSWSEDDFRGLILAATLLPLYAALRDGEIDSPGLPAGLEESSVGYALSPTMTIGLPRAAVDIFEDADSLELLGRSASAGHEQDVRRLARRLSQALPERTVVASETAGVESSWEIGSSASGVIVARAAS
ncbi:hypothetical protein [Microbacterium sp. SLBN-111]|uniref:hypothetical protein n=1 Tax=Microbacterium sp. SLBN-111 TaxID=3377733 RepID=UPI003C796D8A